MLGDRLFLPRLGCAVTTVNPSCRFTKCAKGICPGFQDARHPDLHSSSDQAFCHSEVPDKRLVRARGLPAQGTFSEHAAPGMRLALEACAGPRHAVSQPPDTPRAGLRQTPMCTCSPSPIHDARRGCTRPRGPRAQTPCGRWQRPARTAPALRQGSTYSLYIPYHSPFGSLNQKCSANLQLLPLQSLYPAARASRPTSAPRDPMPWLWQVHKRDSGEKSQCAHH